MIPPKLTRSAGRPRTRRIKNYSEGGTGRKHKCKRCGQLGHLLKTCKEPEIESDADRDATPPPRLLFYRSQLFSLVSISLAY